MKGGGTEQPYWDKIQQLWTGGGQFTFLVGTDHVFLNWWNRHQEKGEGTAQHGMQEPPSSFFRPAPCAMLKEISH